MLSSAVDNDNLLKHTPRWYTGIFDARLPKNIPFDNLFEEDWSVEYLEGYIADVIYTGENLGNIWRCPTVGSEANMDRFDSWWFGSTPFIYIRYSILTGVDVWGNGVAATPKAREELVGSEPGTSEQVMMSDPLYKWHVTGAWAYNHGLDGPSVHGTPSLTGFTLIDYGPPRIEGVNRMMGDMSVHWSLGTEYDTDAMQNLDPTLGFVRSGRDVNFY